MARIPVECITTMGLDEINPIRLRYEDSEGVHVIKISRIIQKDKRKQIASMNGSASTDYVFKCEAAQEGTRIPFTLIFNNQNCRWVMHI